MVTDAEVVVPSQTEGTVNTKDVDVETFTNANSKTVYRQRVRIGGENIGDLADVEIEEASLGDVGLVVKDANATIARRMAEENKVLQDINNLINLDYGNRNVNNSFGVK